MGKERETHTQKKNKRQYDKTDRVKNAAEVLLPQDESELGAEGGDKTGSCPTLRNSKLPVTVKNFKSATLGLM